MSNETTNTAEPSNIVSLEKVKNACFGANPDLHGFCTDSAQGELTENDHCAVIDRALNKATELQPMKKRTENCMKSWWRLN